MAFFRQNNSFTFFSSSIKKNVISLQPCSAKACLKEGTVGFDFGFAKLDSVKMNLDLKKMNLDSVKLEFDFKKVFLNFI